MEAVTAATARWVARRSCSASAPNSSGLAVPGLAPFAAASPTRRQTLCRNLCAPSTPPAVHSMSRSGGVSDSMNQRAVSAPYLAMIVSGSTTFFFDFDIDFDRTDRDRLAGRRMQRGAVADRHLLRQQPFAGRVLVGLVRDHALREETGERLVERDMSGAMHGAGEEARVEQVQDRVLHAADILIDRQPIADRVGVGRLSRVRRAEPREIPGRVDERVHRVGLADGGTAALRAGDMLPGRMAVERIARHVEAHVVGKLHRQVLLGHRHDPACLAVDHRDGTAPIALPRNAPVAQAILDLALGLRLAGELLLFELLGDGFLGGVNLEPVEESRN